MESNKKAAPNIVIFTVSDLSYEDWSKLNLSKTAPFLSSLESNGISLDSFYASPQSIPSRSSIMNGNQPTKAPTYSGIAKTTHRSFYDGQKVYLSSIVLFYTHFVHI
jgi:arylsulfatase A-like enzyme